MAFGLDRDFFSLKEARAYIGDWTNLLNIGVLNQPLSSFFTGGVEVSWIKQGTLKVNLKRTYAQFKARTPFVLVRKDLIGKEFDVEFSAGQFNADVIELMKGTLSQKTFSIGGGNFADFHFLGSDEPVQPPRGYMLDATLTNGNRLIVGVWSGRMLGEDISMAYSGTDYAVTAGKIQAFSHPDFDGVTDEAQKHYGIIYTEDQP